MSYIGRIRRLLFGVPSAKAVFSRPGFAPEAWSRFQPVARSLIEGYHATLVDPRLPSLQARLDAVEPQVRGFAYEGAGMGLAGLDAITPWRDRVTAFANGPAAPHLYPFYVGVGLAYARLKRAPETHLDRLDPLLGWVTADGYGFHEAFFRRRRYVVGHAIPMHLTEYGRRLFDHGVGRALWFSSGADADRVTDLIAGFQPHRHVDLWSGVGLAVAYGGGAEAATLRDLLETAKPYAIQLARGAATAAWGRQQAGNAAPHTDLACEIFCGRTGEDAARLVDEARNSMPVLGVEPSHEIWRRRVEERLQAGSDPRTKQVTESAHTGVGARS